jgi:hypothetical protein
MCVNFVNKGCLAISTPIAQRQPQLGQFTVVQNYDFNSEDIWLVHTQVYYIKISSRVIYKSFV